VRRVALHGFLAAYLVLQLALGLRGLLLDRFDTRGDFSWNMYTDRYTCSMLYIAHDAEGRGRDVPIDRQFRNEVSSTKVMHRDALPAFHAWLCDEIGPEETRLTGLVSCSLNGGPWRDLVDPTADLCHAPDHGVLRP
jgi:hypothetical protein